jgi:two-component system, NarL family, invasion response regulator UvrY
MLTLETLQVLLVDDHAVMREGLRMVLEEGGRIRCAQAGSAEEALAHLDRGHAVNVLLLDINLPGMSGLEALPEIRRRRPQLAVLMLSMHPEEQLALRALRLGAQGYLSKRAHPDEILQAVEALARGESYLPPRIAGQIARGLADGGGPAHGVLSNREFEVMTMLGSGRTVSEIGVTLGLSVKTISTHRERILEKMNFSSNMEIMRYALREGLVE